MEVAEKAEALGDDRVGQEAQVVKREQLLVTKTEQPPVTAKAEQQLVG